VERRRGLSMTRDNVQESLYQWEVTANISHRLAYDGLCP
jgi:hypothetical protein